MPNLKTDDILQLQNVLSEEQFSRYLRACNNNYQQAVNLYRWNLIVSGNFMIPVHIAVVTLRNAIVEAVTRVYGEEWPWSDEFRLSLPEDHKKYLLKEADKREHNKIVSEVIADLNLYFWERMLTNRQHVPIWRQQFKTIFPNAPYRQGEEKNRKKLYHYVDQMRELRNGIAHYEWIFDRDLKQDLRHVEKIVFWRSKVVSDWMEKLHNLDQLIAKDPRKI